MPGVMGQSHTLCQRGRGARSFRFNLSCIGATLRRCSGMSQIMPGAARLIQEDSKSYNQGRQPALPRSPAMIRALGRDAENTVIAKVVRVGHEQSSVTMDRIELVDYQVIEVLKGTFTTSALHATFYPNCNNRDTGFAPAHHCVWLRERQRRFLPTSHRQQSAGGAARIGGRRCRYPAASVIMPARFRQHQRNVIGLFVIAYPVVKGHRCSPCLSVEKYSRIERQVKISGTAASAVTEDSSATCWRRIE
jgi:hypothetical protein